MVRPVALRTNHQIDPVGFDDPEPILSWALADVGPGERVAAARIRVATRRTRLEGGSPDLWDSGRVDGGRTALRYRGAPLPAGAECWWTVEVWDEDGSISAPADPVRFETGLGAEGWVAPWVGFQGGWAGQALMLRRRVGIERKVVRARAYVASVGWHELRVNGRPVDGRVLEPAPSVLTRRVLSSTYKLDDLLDTGDNVIGALLSGGWVGASSVKMEVHLEFEDGTREVLVPGRGVGERWEIAPSSVISSSPYDGEVRDQRLHVADWDAPGPDVEVSAPAAEGLWSEIFGARGGRERAWANPQVLDGPGGRPFGPVMPPATVTEEHAVSAVTEPKEGVWVADAGANGAGWARVVIRGAARGQPIILRYSELLYDNGLVNQENLRNARSSDIYLCAGEPTEVFEPTFAVHGFRYVQIEGLPERPAPDDVVVKRARTPAARRASFSGDQLLEQIFELAVRTEASNTLGMLTDCPQRNERHGWLNDLTDRLDTAVLAHDLAPLLRKVQDDIADSQREDGAVPDTVPFRWGFAEADPVCLAPVLLPKLLWQHWGDDRAVEVGYPVARSWLQYLLGRAGGGVLEHTHWGDWAEPKAELLPPFGGAEPEVSNPAVSEAVSQRTPGALVSTACLAWGLRAVAELADLVGERAHADEARRSASGVEKTFRAAFRDPRTGGYGTGSQGCLATALALGMVAEQERARVFELLAADVEKRGYLTTGNVATKFVLEVLSDLGRHDLALGLARRVEYPSWGYMVEHGATTLWERWELATGSGMNSHNHGMLGAIGSWLITRQAGLALADDAVGSDKLAVRIPMLSEDGGAGATLATPRGEAAVRWRREAGRLEVVVAVPAGVEAAVELPARAASCTVVRSGPAPDGAPVGGGSALRPADTGSGWSRVTLDGGAWRATCEAR